jgi:peroxiredoxin family protein
MTRVAVFLHSGDYERMHQGLSIAASAAAGGREVLVFFFWWALERLAAGRLDEPDFGDAPERAAAADRFEARGLPTLRALLEHVRQSGKCRLFACSGSLAAVADRPDGLERAVDQVVGWSTILELTAGVTDRFDL